MVGFKKVGCRYRTFQLILKVFSLAEEIMFKMGGETFWNRAVLHETTEEGVEVIT